MSSSCARGGSDWILGKVLLRKSGEGLEQAALGSGGVTIPGGSQEMCKCGTKEQGLVGSVGGRWMFGLGDLRGLFQP